MLYAKVDLSLLTHPRALAAGEAMATWLWALLYTREHELDGHVPAVSLRLSWTGESTALSHVESLVDAGLLCVSGDGWDLVGYAEKNETREAVRVRREYEREKKRRFRDRREKAAVPPDSLSPGDSLVPSTHVSTRDSRRDSPGESRGCPGSGSGSGSGSEISESEKRAQPVPPEAGAPDPRAIPGWFSAACETVELTSGETIDRPLTWIRYSGHRSGTAKATGQADAAYWLASVVVAEHKRERRLAAERAARPAYGRQGPPEKPKPTQAELDRQRADLVARVRSVVQEHAPSSGEDDPGTRFEAPGDPGSHQWGPGPSTGILARSLKGPKRSAGGDS